MPRRIKHIIAAVVLLGVLFVSGKYGFTVVSTERVEDIRIAGLYDAETYVDEIWESSLIPTIEENAVDLVTILQEFEVDEEGITSRETIIPVAERYGLVTAGEAHVYMVKGEGTVVSVDLDSRVGVAELELAGYEGATTVNLFLGPRIPSDESSVRDAVGFITFGDFRDQTEYGRVAAAINSRINRDVLEPLDKENLEGKEVSFLGAFSIRTFNLVDIDLSEINVTPTHLQVVTD
jgi:predicted lipoprotein